MITRISASFLGGTVRQCAEMAVNRALIPLSGVIAAYREQPTHQLGTLSQREFLVVSLASSARSTETAKEHIRVATQETHAVIQPTSALVMGIVSASGGAPKR
jgi:hypothetical protein